MLRQRLDRALEVLAGLPGQEPALGRSPQLGRRIRPVPGLGRMVGRPKAVRSDRDLLRLELGVEAREGRRPCFPGGAGLRAVDENAIDPGLE
jgi:hypothetical protein